MFLLLVFVHLLFIFAAVAVAYGPLLLLALAVRSGRVEAVRGVTSAVGPLTKVIPALYGIGALFGLIAAINVGYNLLAPWLVIAYVLFVVLTGIGAGIIGPWAEKIGVLAAAAPDGPLTPEIVSLAGDSRIRIIRVVDLAVVVALIFDMVVKPFS